MWGCFNSPSSVKGESVPVYPSIPQSLSSVRCPGSRQLEMGEALRELLLRAGQAQRHCWEPLLPTLRYSLKMYCGLQPPSRLSVRCPCLDSESAVAIHPERTSCTARPYSVLTLRRLLDTPRYTNIHNPPAHSPVPQGKPSKGVLHPTYPSPLLSALSRPMPPLLPT